MTGIDAVYYVSQRRWAPTSVRHFLSDAGFGFDAQIVAPEAFPGALLGENCLTMIDAGAETPWAAIAAAIAESPRRKFVFCGRSITPGMVHAAMNAGLHGLLSLRMPRMEAGIALARICEGERRFCFQAGDASRASDDLTPAETKVLALAAIGRRNKEIACKLGMTEASVKVHVHHLLRKTGAKNRGQLAEASGIAPAPAAAPRTERKTTASKRFDSRWMFADGNRNTRSY